MTSTFIESTRADRRRLLAGLTTSLAVAACGKGAESRSSPTAGLVLPDIALAKSLPQFAAEVNEVEIADSFNDVHPSWVIGALVNVKTRAVHALDGFLKKDAKPAVVPQTEVVFRNFIENGLAANAEWLEFVKAHVDDTTRAEVCVTKAAKVSVDSESVDRALLLQRLQANRIAPREDFGVVIGYTAYLLSAAYFRSTGANGSLSGYGAKIGGSWFNKSENSAMHHRIVATWAPLPFVVESVAVAAPGSLTVAAAQAVKAGQLKIPKLPAIKLRLP